VPLLNLVLQIFAAGLIVMPFFSCTGTRPTNLGVKNFRLAECPSTPNCVTSDTEEASHHVPVIQLAVSAEDAWRAVRSAVAALPRTKIVNETSDYIHAECSSAFFGFVDDLELHLRPAQASIAVRSAARLGHSDFGVNRKRVEELRSHLRRQGVVR